MTITLANHTLRRRALAAAGVAGALLAAGCGGSSGASSSAPARSTTGASSTAKKAPEVNPAGDIPDTQAYVRYAPPGAGFSLKVPEGWSRTSKGGATIFTDKLNAVRVESSPASGPLTPAAARRQVLPQLAATVRGFTAGSVSTVTRPAGQAVRITYEGMTAPDPVTGRSTRAAFERYVFFHAGRRVVLTLSAPKGADNVDPWRIVTSSLRWSR